MIENCTLHNYEPNLASVQHPSTGKHSNLVLFLGGLGDALGTVPYVAPLARALDKQGWAVAEIETRSTRSGYGTGSLDRDITDINTAATYFKQLGYEKLVFAGHSTGTQDAIHHALNQSSKGWDEFTGYILQACVSDQEYALHEEGEVKIDQIINWVQKEYIDQGKGQEVLPMAVCEEWLGGVATTAYRFKALIGKRGDDDYFSSYLTDEEFEQTFGNIKTPFLVCYSGEDECAKFVDKQGLVARWARVSPQWSKHSGIVPGATHNIGPGSGEAALPDFVQRVSQFLDSL